MNTYPVCPAPVELRLDRLVPASHVITIIAVARRPTAVCPGCGHCSHRMHAWYTRTLADLPWHGLPVRLTVRVRKWRCEQPQCPRRIFCERLPVTAAPYRRRTERAAAALTAIGFALGGRPGARLAQQLGLPLGATALLQQLQREPLSERPTPRVLGVDDWAWRRGQRYGTILVDLERHTVVDLLPDRTADTLATWLRTHPGVEFISRDRGGSYAEGARRGAPAAIQIADRFHLLCNLLDAVEHACHRHQATLQAVAATLTPARLPRAAVRQRRYSGRPRNRPGPTPAEQQQAARRARRHARYAHVVALRAAGISKPAIARLVGIDRRTVRRWLAAGQFPERVPRRRRAHVVDPFAAYLRDRYDAGIESSTHLTRELRARGYRGSLATVHRYLVELRQTQPRGARAPPPSVRLSSLSPSPRHTAWLLHLVDVPARAAELTTDERAYVAAVCTRCPALARVRTLATAFRQLLRAHEVNALGPWLEAAAASDLHRFALGVRRDQDAVLAAVLFPWSQGPVEGQVHRLKLLKRAMYGRAAFALLRRRVLHAA